MSNPGHPVAQLPPRSRMTVMEPVNGGSRTWHGRVLKILLLLAVIFVVLAFNYPMGMPGGGEYNTGDNGVWVADKSAQGGSQPSPAQVAGSLEGRGIKWVYVDAGEFEADGSLPANGAQFGRSLASYMHETRSQMSVLAWVSGHNQSGGGNLSLDDPSVRSRIVAACQSLVANGFDGVQLDIEPVPSGDQGFLELLDEIRPAIGGKYISVAAMKWTPLAPHLDSLNLLPYSWDSAYFEEVARRANQVVLMAYDTGLPFANLYIKYVAWQTEQVLGALRDQSSCQVLIGVPTYSDEHWYFHPVAENEGSGLQGVIEGLKSLRRSGELPSNFGGVALFAQWSTSPDEWNTFGSVWQSGSK